MSIKEKVFEDYKQFEVYKADHLSAEAIDKVIIDIELKLANNYNLIMDNKNNIEACFETLDKYPEDKVEAAMDIANRIMSGAIGKKQLPEIEKEYGEIVANTLMVAQKIQDTKNKFLFNKFYEDRLNTFYQLRNK